MPIDLTRFPAYPMHDPAVPVHCVTPELDMCIHRFFDTSPISPSGKYLAVTRLPCEDRLPVCEEGAEVVVVDLESGESRLVARTAGFDTQLGAQVQWGATDRELFYNDVDVATWRAHGVRLDISKGGPEKLAGPVYMVSPDGKHVASPCLLRTGLTQAGYGVLVPAAKTPLNPEVSDADGIYVTDVAAGTTRVITIRQIVDAIGPGLIEPEMTDGALYGFHVKWNPQGDRLMFVMRYRPDNPSGQGRPMLITCRPDGSDIHLALQSRVWRRGGHHPNWCPDGERIIMNLRVEDDGPLRFVTFGYDGSDLAPLTTAVPGSGHPTLHPDGRHVLADAYPHESVSFDDGTVPIRWVDVTTGQETRVARIASEPDYYGPVHELRVDPHPAWDRTYRYATFNAYYQGTRKVFVADMERLLGC